MNLLRGTTIAFAAAAGGADAVVLLPYDACLGASDAEARRLAANTHALLALESRLGFVEDPGAGAGLVEELTAALARRAWELFQELVAQGGVDAAHASGWLDTRIAESADRDARDVRTRRRGIVGVSEYPALDEALPTRPPLREAAADARLAAPFEALRARSDRHLAATGARPRAFLANLGPVAEHTARATFARNLLAAGGIEAPANDGFASVGDAVAAFEASGARLCVICSSDARYAEAVPELAPELARRGALVVVAGRAGEREDAWRAAGVAHFVHLGCDALASLAALLDAAEVAA
ncbi:MAG: hypothetical protein H6828_02285 [Planctomycetes bacterium]|nr:hypothetical protein [Planctomycetota bacterium]